MTPVIDEIIKEFAQRAKEILKDDMSKMIMYGSYARGEQRENSDVDLMILTPISDQEIGIAENKLYDLAFEFFMQYFIDISVILKNEEHFNQWVNDLPFYHNVQKEGIVVYG